MTHEEVIRNLLDADPTHKDTAETMKEAATRLNLAGIALLDIATCNIPNVPAGVTVSMAQYGPFARERASKALGELFPAWKIEDE